MKKILIIRFSSIGDIVLTTPVVRCIKQQRPETEVHYVTKSIYKGILENNPYIDKIHIFENNLKLLINKLKAEKFDLIIDLHNNLRSHIISYALNIKTYRVNKLNFRKFLYVNFKINLLPDIHIVDRYFNTTRKIGIINDNKGLDFFSDKLEWPVCIKEDFKSDYIAWVIGGKHTTKIFPSESIIHVCKKLSKRIILLGDINDKGRGDAISSELENVFNAAGALSLDESALVIKNAETVITNDTGLMHIAAALNKKVISLWGNTVTDFGMYPYMPQSPDNFKVVEVKDIRCRPCSKLGFEECPKKHFRCMMEIDVNEIISLINVKPN